MYDLSTKLNTSEHLIEALCLLNYLLSNSPSNFHAKLLCLQIYHRLGCSLGAQKTYENLNFKFIQLDSLGYLHASQMPVLGLTTVAKALYDQTLKFFTNSHKESMEYLSMCYRFGSFSKLQEFMDFRDRLSNSFHFSLTSVEALLLELVTLNGTHQQNVNIYKSMRLGIEEDRIQWSELRDNRDLSLLVRWDPDQTKPEQINLPAESYIQDKALLRIRAALLRLVGAFVECICQDSSEVQSKTTNKLETLQALASHWDEVFADVRGANHQPTSTEFLVDLLPSRLHAVLRMPYESHFRNLAKLILGLEQGTDDAIEELVKCCDADIAAMAEIIVRSVENNNLDNDPILSRRSAQESIGMAIEVCILLQTFHWKPSH